MGLVAPADEVEEDNVSNLLQTPLLLTTGGRSSAIPRELEAPNDAIPELNEGVN